MATAICLGRLPWASDVGGLAIEAVRCAQLDGLRDEPSVCPGGKALNLRGTQRGCM